ncbi:hypothetical protein [Chitinophaga sp. GbtcB8]|uniref:hypothetical protein n=1 Tax=Chitinophaga sp. GbtcB8 TaxID=2824753 RepID=UPI001C308B42|nr:hypothetical protein [Chitinophaga sp. GbtcB8]
MKALICAVAFLLMANYCFAQHIYQIRADTVRIYNTCDTAELVLENHTQDTLGFLYNKGKGRTEFRKLQLEKIGNNKLAITGQDTLDVAFGGASSDNLYVPRKEVVQRNMRKTFRKVLASSTSKQQIVIFPFGDSMAGRKMKYLGGALGRTLIDGNQNDNGIDTIISSRYRLAGGPCATSSSGIVNNTTDFQHSASGISITIPQDVTATFNVAGSDPIFTHLKIYYYKEPGAGSFILNVGGTDVATINAANTADTVLGIYKFTQAVLKKTITIRAINGPVNFYEVHYLDTTKSGVDQYTCSQGGIALNDMFKYNAAKKALATYIADGNVDLMTYEMKEGLNYPDGTTYTQRLNELSDILDATMPQGAKVFIGSTPVSSSNDSQISQNDTLFKVASDRGFIYWDGYTPVKDYQTMVALGWNGDGIHPAESCQAYLVSLMYQDLGLDNIIFGTTPRAVNDRGRASHLGRNSTIGMDVGKEMIFSTDATFGIAWDIMTPSLLRFSNSANGTVAAQFSNNLAVNPNVLPSWYRIGSATAAQQIRYFSIGGLNFYRLIDTNVPDSNLLFQAGAIRPGSYLSANLPAANTVVGSIAYVRDAAGGRRLMWAHGDGTTDWQAVNSWTVNGSDIFKNNPGDVGIGVDNPQFLLHVQGSDTIGLAVQNTDTLSNKSGASIRMYNSGLPTAANQRIGSLVYGVNPTGNNTLNGARIEAWSDAAWAYGQSQATSLRFLTTNAGSSKTIEQMRISPAGDVGIGTTTPGAKLEVSGQVKITGGNPAKGAVLVSDSTGLASWQSSGNLTGGLFMNIKNVTGSYTVVSTDVTILDTPSGAGQTITLPAASSATGRVLFLRNLSSTNAIALSQAYIQSDSQTVSSLPAASGVTIQSNGTSWYKIGF